MNNFDLASLRVSLDLKPATRPDFGLIRLGKPSKRVFVGMFHIPAQSEIYWLLEDVENKPYLVAPYLAFGARLGRLPCLPGTIYVTRDTTPLSR